MKTLLENWNKKLTEAEELPPENKSEIFDNVESEADAIVGKIRSASAGDSELAKEAMQSLIVALQNSLERL
jgi:hypothetical protein